MSSSSAAPTVPDSSDPSECLDWLLTKVREKVTRREAKFTRWKTAGFWIGGLGAVLGAVAGVGILTDWIGRDIAGALAIAAALTSALVGFYDFEGRAARTGIERAEWSRLLGQLMDLDRDHDRSTAMDKNNRATLTALWDRYSSLLEADASARVRK